MYALKSTWNALYAMIVLLIFIGFLSLMYNGPITKTHDKYAATIINVGNGLFINGKSFTLGSVEKKIRRKIVIHLQNN